MSDRTREMATVRENSRILDGYYKMTLHAPVIAQRCRPGQFVFIRVGSGTAPLLRRPISICEADSIGGTLTLLYRVVGTGTDLLSAVRAGQALDVMGPIGTPFPVEGEQAILVAGGMGAAPLCMLARALHDAGSAVTVYLGCRDAAHDLCGKTLRTYGTVHTAYESEGRLVTDILPETAAGAVYACGPTAMLAKVQQWAAQNGAEGYVSLEERMACGIGAALIQMLAAWASGEYYIQLVGASGAVMGLLLAFGVMHPNAMIVLLIPPIPMKAKWFVIIYGVIELFLGWTGYGGNVAHFAHVGGMLWGFLLLHYWKRRGNIYF